MAQNRKTQRKFRRKSSKKNVGKRRRTKVKRRVKKGGVRWWEQQFMFRPEDEQHEVITCSQIKDKADKDACYRNKREQYQTKLLELGRDSTDDSKSEISFIEQKLAEKKFTDLENEDILWELQPAMAEMRLTAKIKNIEEEYNKYKSELENAQQRKDSHESLMEKRKIVNDLFQELNALKQEYKKRTGKIYDTPLRKASFVFASSDGTGVVYNGQGKQDTGSKLMNRSQTRRKQIKS